MIISSLRTTPPHSTVRHTAALCRASLRIASQLNVSFVNFRRASALRSALHHGAAQLAASQLDVLLVATPCHAAQRIVARRNAPLLHSTLLITSQRKDIL